MKLTASAIAPAERGNVNVTLAVLEKLAGALDVSVDELIN